MGVSIRGWRKVAIILLFTLPTIAGVLLLSLYPIGYNVFISFTNRSRFHMQAPESMSTCTPDQARVYCWNEPILGNYGELFGPWFEGPAILAWIRFILIFIPLIVTNWLVSRTKKKSLSPPETWWWWIVGLAASVAVWYVADVQGAIDVLMQANDFFVVMFRTFLYVVVCIPFFLIFGLLLALILNNDEIKNKGAWRTMLIFPWAVPSYITALIWQFFFRGEQGLFNQILRLIGVANPPAWLQVDVWAFAAVVIINVWLSYPFFMTIILGALQSIPADQYEAADVDGATWLQKLMRITLPLLRPAVMPAIVLSSITTFQMFNTVWLVTNGGPIRGANEPGITEFVMIYGYKTLLRGDRYADAGAFALVIFILLFVATLFSLRMTRITKGAYE